MTRVDEKEILEIEKLKAEVAKIPLETEKIRAEVTKMIHDTSTSDLKVTYEAWRLVFYGVAVGLGGTFAIAKTISLMGW